MFKKFVVTAGLTVGLLVAGIAPAFAHHTNLGASAVCGIVSDSAGVSSNSYEILWTIGNSESNKDMNIESITLSHGTVVGLDNFPADNASTNTFTEVGPSGTKLFKSLVPRPFAGTFVTLTVNASWDQADGDEASENDFSGSWKIKPNDLVCTAAKGDTGATGPQGPQGPQGPKGDDGSQGPAGPQGPVGPAGPQGPVGPTGVTGDEGPQGPVGPAGPTGPGGANGSDGEDGADGSDGAPGTQGEQGADGTNGLNGSDGADGSDGVDGVDGADGATGPAGPQGPAGAGGADGNDGVSGENGKDGAVTTITVTENVPAPAAGPTPTALPRTGASSSLTALAAFAILIGGLLTITSRLVRKDSTA